MQGNFSATQAHLLMPGRDAAALSSGDRFRFIRGGPDYGINFHSGIQLVSCRSASRSAK
jgi:hypothetical protein